MKQGRSFSAREPNCCFLNLQNGTFGDVSTVSGLDVRDDGRGVARTDWDQDGDIDLWISNRNAPRVRFFQNNSDRKNKFLQLRLRGTKSNRDAIGARVEVVLMGDEDRPMFKTLRAGDGFLSQSSKWMHFGLGETGDVASVNVRWPGGNMENFGAIEPDGFYALVEGSGTAQPVLPSSNQAVLAEGAMEIPEPSGQSRFVSLTRAPLPPIRYETLPGEERLLSRSGRAVLLTLWASWCQPCLTELNKLNEGSKELGAARCDVVALSVDRVTENGDEAAARSVSEKLDLSFEIGFADVATVKKLQIIHDLLFDIYLDLPLPVSFLIDGEGKVGTFYRGSVDVSQLVKDVEDLALKRKERRAAGQPYDGKWFAPARTLNIFPVAMKMLVAGYDEDALAYCEANRKGLAPHPLFPRMLGLLGDAAYRTGRDGTAGTYFSESLKGNPRDTATLRSFAWMLATSPDASVRQGSRAVQLAKRAMATRRGNTVIALDALAAAFAEAGDFESAMANIDEAIRQASEAGEEVNLPDLEARREQYRLSKPFRERR